MKRLIAILLGILLFSGFCLGQEKAPVYIIDGKVVENFDGSQLKGKTVTDYQISTVEREGVKMELHTITTRQKSSFSIQSGKSFFSGPKIKLDTLNLDAIGIHVIGEDLTAKEDILYIIDGERKGSDALESLPSSRIKNISILKSDEAMKTYNYPTVIKIETKKN